MLNEWESGLKRTFKMNVADDQTYHVHIPGFRVRFTPPSRHVTASPVSGFSELSIASSFQYDMEDGTVTIGPYVI
jgi:hypothetical protein